MLQTTSIGMKSQMVAKNEVLILCALPMEAREIDKSLGRGKFDVRTIGLGAKRIPKIPSQTRVVIVAGLAGGLDPMLRVGDIVLDTKNPQGLPSLGFAPENPWRVGLIHTSTCAVCSAAEKSAMFKETGALAVDMEQSRVADALLGSEVRLIGLRAISDPAHMAVDPAVLRFIDDTGRVRPLSVISTLATRPGLIPHLRELNSNSKLALRRLGDAVKSLVELLT